MAAPRVTVTVIVATRDRPALLRDALAGIDLQTRRPLEVRIADDGAVPAHEAVGDHPGLEVTVIEARAGQPGAARNAAAAGARGEVLAFLDDDDRWHPSHLEGLAEAFADPALVLAYRDWEAVREHVAADGTRVDLERRVVALDWDPARMRADDHVPPSTFAMRRAAFERVGGFDPTFRYSEDWDLLLRAAALAVPRRVPGVTAEVRLREAGNDSAGLSPERLACLRRLAGRHGMAVPEPRTFWDVAVALGCAGVEP